MLRHVETYTAPAVSPHSQKLWRDEVTLTVTFGWLFLDGLAEALYLARMSYEIDLGHTRTTQLFQLPDAQRKNSFFTTLRLYSAFVSNIYITPVVHWTYVAFMSGNDEEQGQFIDR